MMIIDGHAHVVLPPERQLEMMAAANIDCTILFSSVIHPEAATEMKAFEKELNGLYDIINGVKNPLQERIRSLEELAAIIRKNPAKYVGFGSIPLGLSYKENLAWISKYILANGFRGIGELTPGSGQAVQLEPLFLASREAGNLPLWVHAFVPLIFADIKELLTLAQKYPSVPLIIGHLGGVHWLDTLKAIKEIPNIYIDLSATFTTIAPSFAIKEYPERTFFGSDAPYCLPLTAKTIIEQIVSDEHILQQVLGENIARLLNI